MKNMINRLSLGYFILLGAFLQGMEPTVTIERYQPARDRQAVLQIIKDNYHFLAYESIGQKEGTTEKYLTSSKYTTDVLRVGDTTVGFVNHVAYNFTIFTFHVFRRGLINLIGVDKAFERKGYGTQLLRHAVSELEKLKTPAIGLAVNRNNKKAIALYEKEGFTCSLSPQVIEAQKKAFPPQVLEKMPVFYVRTLNIPKSELPQGNIIQRYPKTSLVLAVAGIGSAVALKNRIDLKAMVSRLRSNISDIGWSL